MMGRSAFMGLGVLVTFGGTLACGGAVVSEPATNGVDAGSIASENGAAVTTPSPGPGAEAPAGSGSGASGAGVGGNGPIVVAPNDVGSSGTASTATVSSETGPGLPGLVALATGQTCPWGMAIDATSVYWTNCGDPTGGYVLSVPKAGGEVVTLAAGDRLSGIAVDSASVYWVAGTSDASSARSWRCPLAGGTPTTLTSRPGPPAHLAVDASYVYWSELMAGTVMKVPLTGGAPTTVASAAPSPGYRAGRNGCVLDRTRRDEGTQGRGSGDRAYALAAHAADSKPRGQRNERVLHLGPARRHVGGEQVPSQGGTATVLVCQTRDSPRRWTHRDRRHPGVLGRRFQRGPLRAPQWRCGHNARDGPGKRRCDRPSTRLPVYGLVNGNASTGQGAVMKLPLAVLDAGP